MKFSKKILRVGNSQGIIIDQKIIKVLNLEEGDWIEINIKKINVGENNGK